MGNAKLSFSNIKDMSKKNKNNFLAVLETLSEETNKIIKGGKTGEITMLNVDFENETYKERASQLGIELDSEHNIPNGVKILKLRYVYKE